MDVFVVDRRCGQHQNEGRRSRKYTTEVEKLRNDAELSYGKSNSSQYCLQFKKIIDSDCISFSKVCIEYSVRYVFS